MAKILSIIAPKGYQDIEYNDSKQALESKDHIVITASTAKEAHGIYGGVKKVDILLSDVKPRNYDAVLFIGGPGSHEYFDDPLAQKLARKFFNSKKMTAAICAAPSILANAGLLSGIEATCFPDQVPNIRSKGAIYTGRSVQKDGLIITADGPDSATEFGEKIAEALTS